MSAELEREIEGLSADAGAADIAVAVDDLADGRTLRLNEERWFHAASTIKVGVLVALHDAIETGTLPRDARVHVRNQFTSLGDDRYFRVSLGRDAGEAVHGYVGRTMRIRDLARHMIVTSSNLATNVLVELLGAEAIRDCMERHGMEGIDFRRGVEDERAWSEGINNRVTATGLVRLLRAIGEGEAVSAAASEEMLDVLHEQQFVSGIPAGLPDGARVANKTGEISTVVHDAGVVYLPERDPYVVVVLTEWAEEGSNGDRRQLIADVSRLVLERFVQDQDE